MKVERMTIVHGLFRRLALISRWFNSIPWGIKTYFFSNIHILLPYQLGHTSKYLSNKRITLHFINSHPFHRCSTLLHKWRNEHFLTRFEQFIQLLIINYFQISVLFLIRLSCWYLGGEDFGLFGRCHCVFKKITLTRQSTPSMGPSGGSIWGRSPISG